MKRSELFFAALLVPVDFVMLALAAFLAYYIRFSTSVFELEGVLIPLWPFLGVTAAVIPFFLLVFVGLGLYKTNSGFGLSTILLRVLGGVSTGFMAVIVGIFFQRDLFFASRFVVVLSWALAILLVFVGRAVLLTVQRRLYSRGIGVHRTVIVGKNENADIITKEIAGNSRSQYQVVGHLPSGKKYSEYKKELDQLIRYPGVDRLIQADQGLPGQVVLRLIQYADEHKVDFALTPDLYQTHTTNVVVSHFAGMPIVELKRTPLDGWGRILKRTLDVVVSFVLLSILSPFIAMVAVLVKLTSRGPVFFSKLPDGSRVERIGQHGEPFWYFKFRSMVDNAHASRQQYAKQDLRKDSPLMKIKDDPRITPIGKFLRRFSIDELPELLLVLKGDMSLVGPRPHLPEEVAKYKKWHREVLRIKPGITGMAQVHGRSDLSFDEEVRLDVQYIENWSLWLDIKILLQTIPAVLRKRQAL